MLHNLHKNEIEYSVRDNAEGAWCRNILTKVLYILMNRILCIEIMHVFDTYMYR